MARVIAVAIQEGGMPDPRGGGVRLVEALAGLIRDAGGVLETGRDVDEVVVADGRASGVRTADGEVVHARRAVLANVTPTSCTAGCCRAPTRHRAGGGAATATAARDMQIHYALSEPPRWEGDERLAGRRSCTSRPAWTASRALSTRRHEACCPPRGRSSSASR